MNEKSWFSQAHHRVRFEWGWRGAQNAAGRRDAVVIVDVLRFSTAVCAAASRGIEVVPANGSDDLEELSKRFGAIRIDDALKPASFGSLERGCKVIVRSPNGATCARFAATAPEVIAGAIVNASAVARRLEQIADSSDPGITVVACGERWREPHEDGPLRFAVEDYLGAGAILSQLQGDLSAEARLCAQSFATTREQLNELLFDCGSGRELIERHDRDSVEFACRLNALDVVPVLNDQLHFQARPFTVQPARQ